MKHGAELRFREPLLSWKTTANGGVEVTTERGTYTAGSLVLASGAWMPELVPILGKTEHVVKQAIGWFGVRRPELFQPDRFPVFILTVEEGNFYGFPLWEHPGFKLGGRISPASRSTPTIPTARRARSRSPPSRSASPATCRTPPAIR